MISDTSPQSMNFAHEMNCLRELIDKTKADLFVEQKAKTQLAAECQGLRSQLIERVRKCLIIFSFII